MNYRRFSTLGLVLGSALPLIGLVAGCTFSSGTPSSHDFDSFEGGVPEAGQPSNPVCNQCLFQQCSGQWSYCQSNAECAAIFRCATAPKCDQACVTACYKAHPSGQAAYTALSSCDTAGMGCGCTDSCGTTASSTCTAQPTVDAGGAADTSMPVVDSGTPTPVEDAAPAPPPPSTPPVNTCSGCTQTSCANERAACASGTDCDQYSQCVSKCQDASCAKVCADAHPAGAAASQALATCTESQCKTPCGL